MIRVKDKTEAEVKRSRGVMDIASRQGNLYAFDPRVLRIEPGWNCRLVDFDPADPEDIALARSISKVGVKEPLTAYMKDGVATLTDGHRRLSATLYALDVIGSGPKTVTVKLEDKYASEGDRLLSQLVRGQGKTHSPIERANAYAGLRDFGWSVPEIAEKVGLEPQTIVDALKLRAGPREIVDMVKAGTVSASLAMDTIKAKRGDGAAATAVLYAGLKAAQAEGKKKVTAKHVEKPAPDLRKSVGYAAGLKRALEIAQAFDGEDASATAVVVALRAEIANPCGVAS